MKKNAGGFTLIELVAVMVILAILAVVAVPQFVDLRTEARQAGTDGVAGALSSASALNYAKEMANGGGTPVATCGAAGALLQGGAVPPGYTINPAATVVGAGAQVTCTVENDDDTSITSNFIAIGV